MRVVLILTLLLAAAGPVVAGPVEDLRDARAARSRDEYEIALRLFLRAADQGSIDAQMELAEIYWRGQMRLRSDKAESAKWYLRAAELGSAKAQRNIGMAYRYGTGVPKDLVRGLMWLNLAVANSNQLDAALRKLTAEERADLAEQMTPAEVAEAQKLADEWKPKR